MNKLKELRKKRGLMQKDISKLLNIAVSTYSYWENGKYEIDNENLKKLADFYNVSTDYILGHIPNEISVNASSNTVISIGRGGERQVYEISDEDAAIVNAFIEKMAKKNN